ncbi:MAG: transposase DNA-binding-containing protein [Planctomycetota bacterium]
MRKDAFAGSVDWLTEWRALDSTMVNVPQLAGEVAGVKFGDERLTNRLVRVVEALGSRPHDSIPAATATRTELEGTYRFFANEKVTPELILSTHFECTRRRCSVQSVALLVQDTTEVNLTQLTEQMSGAGPLANCLAHDRAEHKSSTRATVRFIESAAGQVLQVSANRQALRSMILIQT